MSMINAKTKHIASCYMSGKIRFAEFALTNTCISKCTFCSIWKQQPKVFVDKDKALKAINKMADLGVCHMCFTGGEASMHPDIVELIAEATKRNINSALLVAAPRLLMKEDLLKQLKEAGCDLISISFDSGDPKIMEESRQIPHIMDDMRTLLQMTKKAGLKTMASVLIWNHNYDSLEQVCIDAQKMGFDFVSLNYPTYSESSTYELGGSGIDFPKEKLIESLETAIKLRKSGKYNLVNPSASMQNIVNYLKDPASVTFPCYGGSRVMFVDWFFTVYPCMQLPDSLGNIFDITEKDLALPACNKCNMSWYRDFSAYFGGAKSIPIILESIKKSGKMMDE